MTVVSSAAAYSSSYTSPALLSGDLVVLVVGKDRNAGGVGDVSTPAGWQKSGASVNLFIPPGGGASGGGATYNAVFWRRASAAGTLSASWSYSVDVLSVVLRGPTALAGAGQQTNNSQNFAYPALTFDDPMTGHVLHVGVCYTDFGSAPTPSGDTARQSAQVTATGYLNGAMQPVVRRSWLAVSERVITSATSTPAASTSQRVYGVGITLAFASVAGPAAPTITAPSAGSVDLAAGFQIQWTPSGSQTGYAVRRRLTSGPGAWAWWNGTNWGAASQTVIDGTATTVTVPAAQFTNSATSYDVEVATKGDASRPDVGTYARVVVIGKAAPTLSTATVSPLSGSNVTSLTPTVTLSGAAGSGGTLSGYRVRVDQDLGAGWVQVLDSGLRPSSPWAVSVAQAASLTNGALIRFRSVAVQDGAQESAAITSATYTLNAPTPAAPTVSAASSPHPLSGAPGVEVTVTSAPLGTAYLARVFRDGVLLGEYPTTGVVVVNDYSSPSSGQVVYSATITSGDGVSTVLVTSPLGLASALDVDGDLAHCWLSDPTDPSTAVRAHLVADEGRSYALNTSVFRTLGDPIPLAHSMPTSAPEGTLTVEVWDPDTEGAVLDLLGSGRRLKFRGFEERDALNGGWHPARDLFFRPVGDVSVQRPGTGPVTWRYLSFAWVSTDTAGVGGTLEDLILDGGAP